MAKAKTEEELDDERFDAAADEAEEELSESEDGSDEPRDAKDGSEERAPQKIRGRPGRKRKNHEPHISASARLSEDGGDQAKLFATKDLATIWNMVVNQAREQGMPAEAIGISCKKLGLGPIPSGEQDMATINGELVMGDDHMSPGEALVNYITHVYHLPTARSAKLYKCRFWYRTGTRNRIAAPEGELRLGPPEEVQAELAAKAQFAAQKAVDEAVRGVGKPPGVAGYRPPQPPYPSPGQAQGYPPPYPGYYPQPFQYQPPPPIQGASPELEAMRREMATMMGAINERARLEGLTPPAAPVVHGPTAEEQAAVIARTVAQTLVGLGFTPDLARKLNSPTMTADDIRHSVQTPMDGAKAFFQTMREYRKMQVELEEEFAPPEEPKPKELPPTPTDTKVEVDKTILRPIPLAGALFGGKVVPNFGEKGEDEALSSYVARLAMGNPEIALGFVEKLSNSALAQALPAIVQKLMAAGMPAVANAMQAKQIAAANGNSNGAVVNAPQPTQPAPPAWGPPKV
jgi:hypothetical protein